jgi:hypothetical protein
MIQGKKSEIGTILNNINTGLLLLGCYYAITFATETHGVAIHRGHA